MTTDTATRPAKRPLRDRLPVVHQLRQSVGLQRGMLVAGLALTNFVVDIIAALIDPRVRY